MQCCYQESPRSQTVVSPVNSQKSNTDSGTKDGVAYACLLKNELLGAGIEDVKEQQTDGQRAVLMPKETRNLFQVRIYYILYYVYISHSDIYIY